MSGEIHDRAFFGTAQKTDFQNICKQELVLFGKRCWNTQHNNNRKPTPQNPPQEEGVELRKQRGKY